MPLVERYSDWSVHDQSFDDPHTVAFDHRLLADTLDLKNAEAKGKLADVENNLRATCVITRLESSYGWVDAGAGNWVYDPDALRVQARPTLGDHFNRNLAPCIEKDQRDISATLTANPDPTANVTDGNVMETLKAMTWPADGGDSRPLTSFETRFPLDDQYIVGETWSSGYHLGNGFVATAGHCILPYLSKNTLSSLKAVFGWRGNVRGKRFSASQIFDIEKVMLCDNPGEYGDATDLDGIANWACKWDDAVFKLKGPSELFEGLGKVKLASRPPRFGTPVYNAGHPLGTPLKVSWKSHVLRHAIFNGDDSPFCHTIHTGGRYTTDLDQFPGNSGGPVFHADTGDVVGHTASTQDAVSEATMDDIEAWEKEFLSDSKNYKAATETINPHLAQKKPSDPSYRIHPKFFRTLSGNPTGGALFLNTTFICPGDIAPNRKPQPPNTHHAVFNRHKWDSPDVVHRNLTSRISRIYLFTTPLNQLIQETTNSTLTLNLTSPKTSFTPPSTITITSANKTQWPLPIPPPTTTTTTTATTTTHTYTFPIPIPLTPTPLASWTHIHLSQPTPHAPSSLSLDLTFHKPRFPFPIDKRWPPHRPDVTDDPAERDLQWPAEVFRFATSVGETEAITQTGMQGGSEPLMAAAEGGEFIWVAPIDRLWTNPDQPFEN